ncbi:MAG: 1,6-anhydro-N-acetylmuramyl-L-alanine amidase AmpD [Gammaproteobacteria bacterium]|nr:1,6-anhydro-N-acetylmuramyl-L-alanine amidase AmpD [Gammaproteobacteria bacterium]MCY4219506.1 1,6-anhydro-N-acetylmuramyl-L-alanine amidase AmpD [Gammaproteobacteria bacterium]MCY4274785.1 1,6-anhydro-N-acetylmuramyl-L-alanine amidase AmpD [Gammaproteobacteria bacterium]
MEHVNPKTFEHDNESGFVSGATQISSPNFDARPSGTEIDVIVIHAISLPPNKFGGNYVEDLFTNQLDIDVDPFFRKIANIRLSSHFYINRNGHLKQFVSTNDRAWHAGLSNYNGREKVNDFSIGIELEGCDDFPFEIIQYQVLASLTHCLISAISSISTYDIVGHSVIAPDRKTDPGPCFNWYYYRQLIQKFNS